MLRKDRCAQRCAISLELLRDVRYVCEFLIAWNCSICLGYLEIFDMFVEVEKSSICLGMFDIFVQD